MQPNDKPLFAAYKRRALLTPGLLALLAVGIAAAPLTASGQAQPPPAGQVPVPTTVQGAPAGQTPPAPGTPQTGAQTPGAVPTDPNGKPITITPQPRRTFDPSQFGGQGGGQFGQGRGRDRSGSGAFPAGGGLISMDFRGSDIRQVLSAFAQMTGMTVTADAAVSGYVTIISPKMVPLDDAFKILQAVLLTRGFTATIANNVISIVPFKTAVGSSTKINTDKDINKADPRNEVMTQIIPLENVDSDSLAKELQPLITNGASLVGSTSSNALILTDTGDNIKRFLAIVDQVDKASANTEMVIYSLKRAEATNVANIINNIYSQNPTTGNNRGGGFGNGGGNRGAFGAAGMAQINIPGMTGQGGSASSKPVVVAIADARTNSVIVTASRDKQTEISKKLISMLDDADANTMDTHMIKIKYADATSLATLINSVLSNMHGTSSTTSGGGNRGGGGGGFNPFQFLGGGGGGGNNSSSQQGTSTDPFAQVVADARTNSVLVTASSEKMSMIEQYIKQIDVAVPTETTTFVIKLRNAGAADVATALSNAFGTTTTTNTNNQNQTRNGQSTTSSGGSGNGTSRTAANRTFGSAP